MGRKQKHPEHAQRAQQLMNSLLDEVVGLWTSEEEPELKAVAEEVEISPSKLRKLLITAGERDRTSYYGAFLAFCSSSCCPDTRHLRCLFDAAGRLSGKRLHYD